MARAPELEEPTIDQRQALAIAANEYADVKFRSGSVGETAKAGLYETRHLNVGRVAPDIEGRDQNGKQFKLSDYRGKVVLLYFWSEY